MTPSQLFHANRSESSILWAFLAGVCGLVAFRTATGDMGTVGKAIATILFGGGAIAFAFVWNRYRTSPPDTIEVTPQAIVWTNGGDRYVKLHYGELRLLKGRNQAWWTIATANNVAEYGSVSKGPERTGEGSIQLMGFDANQVANACAAAGWRFQPPA